MGKTEEFALRMACAAAAAESDEGKKGRREGQCCCCCSRCRMIGERNNFSMHSSHGQRQLTLSAPTRRQHTAQEQGR